MSNIRVDVDYTIKDGTEIKFRSPVDCSQITGLIVYYPGVNGSIVSKLFTLADAHGNNVGDIDHLFAEDVVVKVILDVTKGMAFVQNADTNAYLEAALADKLSKNGGTVTGDIKSTGRVSAGDNVYMYSNNEGGNIVIIPPSDNTHTNQWEMDSYNGSQFRIFANKKSTNANGSGNVFPLTLYTDGSIGVGNAEKTRKNIGVAPAVESSASPGCYYRTVDGVTEWINPPMIANTEYKTTERWGGNPVYVKRFDFSALGVAYASVGTVVTTESIKVVSVEGVATFDGNQYQFPLIRHDTTGTVIARLLLSWSTQYSCWHLYVRSFDTDMSSYSASVTVKYIKS